MQGVHRPKQRDCAAVLRGACSTPACHHDCASPDKTCCRACSRLLRQAKKATGWTVPARQIRPSRSAGTVRIKRRATTFGSITLLPRAKVSRSAGWGCERSAESEALRPSPIPLTTGLPGSPTQRSFPSGCSGNSMWRPLLPEPARDAGGPGRKQASARSRAASGTQSRTRLAPKMNPFHRPGLNTRRDFSTRDELHGRLRLVPIRFLHRLRPRLQRYSPPELTPNNLERSQSLNDDQGAASLGTGRER
jgi:hypothetical protein